MMSTANPSHLLISRNPPRSPAHPQLAPTSTARHSPSASLPPNFLGPWISTNVTSALPEHINEHSDDLYHCHESTLSGDGVREEQEENVVIHPTFRPDSAMPGKVRVVVGKHVFWCHKEILWFASPFFQALLEGSWAETFQSSPLFSPMPSRRESVNTSCPTDIDSAPLPVLQEQSPQSQSDEQALDQTNLPGHAASVTLNDEAEMTPASSETGNPPEVQSDDLQSSLHVHTPEEHEGVVPESSVEQSNEVSADVPVIPVPLPISHDPGDSNTGLESSTTSVAGPSRTSLKKSRRRIKAQQSFSSASIHRPVKIGGQHEDVRIEAVVELKEESAIAFQDFLFWCYPHLECKVTWTNVEDLLALSLKLLTPALQKLCEHFLMTHASGRPVMALMLAEWHGISELYREASRFVLDQPTWSPEEMDMLSEATQLNLSKKRNWFLERLLKLGSIDVKKEYTCRPDCPDPTRCQAQLDEKWRQAHSAVSRYGPPQPSVAFRCLRQLEVFPTNPSLVMPHPLCQSAAKAWVISLFDRMFQPKVAFLPHNPGTEKYWLCITMP